MLKYDNTARGSGKVLLIAFTVVILICMKAHSHNYNNTVKILV